MKRADAPKTPDGDDPVAGLAGALHEVSNALTVVLGWLEAARDRLPEGAGRNAVEVARVHARQGQVLARRAIGAAIADEDAVQPAASVARDAALGVRQEALRKQVKVQFDDGGIDLMVEDAPAVLQVLLNLLLNAIAFSPDEGTVTLALSGDATVAIFVVKDEGPGIPPERAKRLFSSTDSTRRGGAGIGLRHCKGLAERAGGDLNHVPTSVGTRFELLWPAGEMRSTGRQKPVPIDDLTGRRLLVVEDDRAVLSLIEVALQQRGAKVWSVTNLRELDAVTASGETFDAALVDLSPIEDDPVRALRDLRQASPGLPVIIISGTAVGVPRGAEGHVDRWVQKPFHMDEVIDALRDVSGGAATA